MARTLPQKREGDAEMTMGSPNSKVQKKVEAITKAQEWARKRKGGIADAADGDDTSKKARAEDEDVLTNLPNIPTKKIAKSDVSDTESVGSRTRSRRRSVDAAAAAAPASSSPIKSPRKTPAKSKKAVAREQVVEEQANEETSKKEEENMAPAEAEATKANETKSSKTSYLPHFAVFLHSVFIQWSIAFAVIMTFCLDWWFFQFGPTSTKEVPSSQRASSSILGIWLITVAGYSIAFGTFSKVGWILTTSSLAMLSFAVKMLDEDMSSASLPVYVGISIPDLLLCISFAACLFVMKQPPVKAASEPSSSSSDQNDENVAETKEVMEAVMIAASKEATGPRSLIGQRVSVEENGVPSFGTVADYEPETRLWKILYDDRNQDGEELNRVELASAFKSYSKELADSLKAMWKSGEI